MCLVVVGHRKPPSNGFPRRLRIAAGAQAPRLPLRHLERIKDVGVLPWASALSRCEVCVLSKGVSDEVVSSNRCLRRRLATVMFAPSKASAGGIYYSYGCPSYSYGYAYPRYGYGRGYPRYGYRRGYSRSGYKRGYPRARGYARRSARRW